MLVCDRRGESNLTRKTGVLLSYVLMVLEVLSTLLLTPVIIRTLGDAEYGIYKLTASISAYLLLLDLGIGNSVVRFVAKYRATGNKEQCQKFLGITSIYYAGVAAICLLTGVVLVHIFPTAFAKGLTQDEIRLGQILLTITTINAAITLSVAGFKNTIIAYEHFGVSRGISIVSIVVRVILVVVALRLNLGSVALVSINTLITAASSVFFFVYVIKKLNLRPRFALGDKPLVKEVITYSSLILLQMIATQVNACLDSILLGMFVKSASTVIAVYSVGQQITQYFQSIGSAVTSVLMPGVVRMVENGATPAELCEEMVRIGRLTLMALGVVWSGFFVCGERFITLWVGGSKINAYWVALLLMSVYIFVLTESIGTQVLWAKNEHKEQSILKISVVLINIVLTIALIKWNPLYGATIGTALSLLFGDVIVMNFVFVKRIKINLIHYYIALFKGIVPCLAVTTMGGYLFSLLRMHGWLGLAANIAFMVGIYALCMLHFGMNHYERALVSGILAKVCPPKKQKPFGREYHK